MPSKLTGATKKVKSTAGAVGQKLKEVAQPATEAGIATQFVGYTLSIPLSYGYDFVYSLVAKKLITNQLARAIIKILLPAGIGAAFHFGKLPGGNIVAGTGYGIAIVSAIKLLIAKFGGGFKTLKTKVATEEGLVIDSEWGIEV